MEAEGILHRIADDLTVDWLGQLVDEGVREAERYLARHLAFLVYLDDPSS